MWLTIARRRRKRTNEAIACVRNSGAVVLTGIHAEVAVSLNPHAMRRKEITLFNVRRSNHESELAREMLRQHAKLFAPVITHERPMGQIETAFDMIERVCGWSWKGAGEALRDNWRHA